jgi:hypothetical protein
MIRISDRDYNMKERREAEGRALAPEGRDERLGTQYVSTAERLGHPNIVSTAELPNRFRGPR